MTKVNPLLCLFSLCAYLFLSVGCADTNSSGKNKAQKVDDGQKVSIMTYNVENLFDTKPDADREDYTYLPKALKDNSPEIQAVCNAMTNEFYKSECLNLDWNQSVLDAKMANIAEAILQIDGRGADIVILSEVENILVLRELNERFLKKAGYQTVELVEGEDERGIDIGILSRFPQTERSRINLIEFTPNTAKPDWKRPGSRGIMEVNLRLPSNETLTVFGVHFPSQSNPRQERIDAVNTLNKLMAAKGPGALVIAGGDFNIITTEDKESGLFSSLLAEKWGAVSHLVGCKSCGGTHYYKGAWDFLDALLFSRALVDNGPADYVLRPESLRLPKSGKQQLRPDGTPNRFDVTTGKGASDHMPLYGEIILRK